MNVYQITVTHTPHGHQQAVRDVENVVAATLAQAVAEQETRGKTILQAVDIGPARIAGFDPDVSELCAALEAALENAGLDVSPCRECGEPVACIPDGLPFCIRCAARMN